MMEKQSKYPFATLEVGQEYLVECTQDEIRKTRTRVSAYASMYAKGKEVKFSTKVVEGGVKLTRIK